LVKKSLVLFSAVGGKGEAYRDKGEGGKGRGTLGKGGQGVPVVNQELLCWGGGGKFSKNGYGGLLHTCHRVSGKKIPRRKGERVSKDESAGKGHIGFARRGEENKPMGTIGKGGWFVLGGGGQGRGAGPGLQGGIRWGGKKVKIGGKKKRTSHGCPSQREGGGITRRGGRRRGVGGISSSEGGLVLCESPKKKRVFFLKKKRSSLSTHNVIKKR